MSSQVVRDPKGVDVMQGEFLDKPVMRTISKHLDKSTIAHRVISPQSIARSTSSDTTCRAVSHEYLFLFILVLEYEYLPIPIFYSIVAVGILNKVNSVPTCETAWDVQI